MKKVLYLPLNYGNIIQDGVYDAFRELNCNLNIFDYYKEYERTKNKKSINEKLVKTVYDFKPDIIHMQIQHTNIIKPLSVMEAKKLSPNTIIINWTGDVRNYIPKTYEEIGKISDINLISSTGQIEMFNKRLKNVYYWQIGYNPKLYFPNFNIKTFEYDAVFIANYNGLEKYPGTKDRINACKILQKELRNKFALFGDGWKNGIKSNGGIDQRKARNYYHKSVCSISINHYNDLEHYFSDRLLMALACGRPVISLKFPKFESYFTDMCDLIFVDTVEEIPSKIKLLKQNPDLANFIGKSGANKVFAEHTYYSKVKELLDIAKNKL